MRRVVELARRGEHTWQLDERDLAALETKLEVVDPDSAYVAFTIAAASPEDLAAGDFMLATSGVGAGAANLLGRFCHADPEIEAVTRTIVDREQRLAPNTVLAEIVHQPEGRVGNILCRPALRRHEIAYLARASVGAEEEITIDDLLVSVEGDRVRLRSKRLGRWVEPRMSTAHNPQTISLGIYRFLCALRAPSSPAQPVWDWGPLRSAPHLPRVASGRVVLALEQWTLAKSDLVVLDRPTDAERFRALRALREAFELPRWVSLVDGDNVLPVDLDNALSVDSFIQLVKQRARVVLTEMFPAPGMASVTGRKGRHVPEIILPLHAVRETAVPSEIVPPPVIRRTFAPGSEWLYAKIYAGPAIADAVLRGPVASVVERARGRGDLASWFFIRYTDPHPHLRVRFRGEPDVLVREVWPALHRALEPWVEPGRVHRVGLDTYVREVERYGGDAGIGLAEALFEHDSDLALAALDRFDAASDEDLRWRLAVVGMDRLLDDLGFDLQQKRRLLAIVRGRFAHEHHVDVPLERELGARFRRVRQELDGLLAGTSATGVIGEASALLAQRSARNAAPVEQIRRAAADGELTVPWPELAASLLHMHCNRLLAADHRAQELVLYDFLLRLYESREARARRAGQAGT